MSSLYKRQREEILNQLDSEIVIIKSASFKVRSHDTYYPFRQNSNFFYLTGFNEDQSVLVLTTNPEKKSILFLKPQNKKASLWDGKSLGVDAAVEELGVDMAYPIDKLNQKLPEIIYKHKKIYVDLNDREFIDTIITSIKTHEVTRDKKNCPLSLANINNLIGKQRLIKSKEEIGILKDAAKITHKAHTCAMSFAKAGKSERDLQAIVEYVFKSSGANGPSYDSIVASGKNALILHYIKNDSTLKDNDLLLIDAGCELKNYASDVSRTFPINAKFNPIQRDIYNIVLKAQKCAIDIAAPGKTLKDIHQKAIDILVDGLIDLKIFKEKKEDIIEQKKYMTFYPHGTSHWLGMDVHDNCPYNDENGNPIVLKKGMLFTIEPGLYFPVETKIDDKFKGIGIRIEDDILITNSGNENITNSIPKEIDDVENACASSEYKNLI